MKHFLLLLLLTTLPAFAAEAPPSTLAFLKAKGIDHKIERHNFFWPKSGDPKNSTVNFDAYALRIKLGRLPQEKFDAIKQHYGNLTEVSFSPDRNYELSDFLPPLMQALDQKQLSPFFQDFKWPDPATIENPEDSVEMNQLIDWATANEKLYTYTNCWGTTLAVERDIWQSAKTLELGWLGRGTAYSLFSDERDFRQVPEDKLQFGDILLVATYNNNLGDYVAQHAALVVEPELVFEKTDFSENDAFRISFRKDVIEKMKSIFTKKDKVRIGYYRAKGKLELGSIAQSETLASLAEVYEKYIPLDQLARVVVGDDFNLENEKTFMRVTGYGRIGLSKNRQNERYELDRANPLFSRFREPKWID